MKYTIAIIAVLSLAVGSTFAGCGKTVTDNGKLKSFDKETKVAVVEVEGKEVQRTLTPASKGAEDIDKLVGKKVTVVSSHNKVESITKG
ncbi:MAG TPA: hypothetical protein VD994_03945 [Prosthecobacter sp.]|nr:hypothetical protein [Prosthecobacter sp.]